MDNSWIQQWDERYASEAYAYGVQPNEYLKNELTKIKKGTLLLPAEGEGRNAVFAAQLGWDVAAFDISKEGMKKATQLAKEHHVTIDYKVGELETLDYHNEQFDAIALIYAHFPATMKTAYHQAFGRYLKKGGMIIFEALSKKHLAYIAQNEKVGGPKNESMLYSIEELQSYFAGYEIIELIETEIELKEGIYHNGKGSVIRFVGRKK